MNSLSDSNVEPVVTTSVVRGAKPMSVVIMYPVGMVVGSRVLVDGDDVRCKLSISLDIIVTEILWGKHK